MFNLMTSPLTCLLMDVCLHLGKILLCEVKLQKEHLGVRVHGPEWHPLFFASEETQHANAD